MNQGVQIDPNQNIFSGAEVMELFGYKPNGHTREKLQEWGFTVLNGAKTGKGYIGYVTREQVLELSHKIKSNPKGAPESGLSKAELLDAMEVIKQLLKKK